MGLGEFVLDLVIADWRREFGSLIVARFGLDLPGRAQSASADARTNTKVNFAGMRNGKFDGDGNLKFEISDFRWGKRRRQIQRPHARMRRPPRRSTHKNEGDKT